MSTEKKQDNQRVVLPTGMLSFAFVVTPRKADSNDPNAKAQYSTNVVFPAGTDLKAAKQAAMNALIAKFGPNAAEEVRKGNLRWPFVADDAKNAKNGYPAGSIVISCKSDTQPLVCDAQVKTIAPAAIAQEIYSGVFARVSVRAFGYDKKGNKGVAFALNNIQKIRDGTRIDGRKRPEDEFEPDLSAAPAEGVGGLDDLVN